MLFNIQFKAKQWLTSFLIILFSIQFAPVYDYQLNCWQSNGQEQMNDGGSDEEQAISVDQTVWLPESYHLMAYFNSKLAITRENARRKIPENHAAEINLPPPNSVKL